MQRYDQPYSKAVGVVRRSDGQPVDHDDDTGASLDPDGYTITLDVDAIGREDTGGLVNYTMAVCDNGPANSGQDSGAS